MNIRTILATSLLALATTVALSAGCKTTAGECESFGNAVDKCAGNGPTDWSGKCATLQDDADAANCSSQYSDFISCLADSNFCSATTPPCSAQGTSLVNCTKQYCAAHSSEPLCVVQSYASN